MSSFLWLRKELDTFFPLALEIPLRKYPHYLQKPHRLRAAEPDSTCSCMCDVASCSRIANL